MILYFLMELFFIQKDSINHSRKPYYVIRLTFKYSQKQSYHFQINLSKLPHFENLYFPEVQQFVAQNPDEFQNRKSSKITCFIQK